MTYFGKKMHCGQENFVVLQNLSVLKVKFIENYNVEFFNLPVKIISILLYAN